MKLPTIEHATVNFTDYSRVEITMNKGFVFYDKDNYSQLTDDEGNPREPLPEEISYFRYGVFAPDTDFESRIVAVAESEVNKEQIF